MSAIELSLLMKGPPFAAKWLYALQELQSCRPGWASPSDHLAICDKQPAYLANVSLCMPAAFGMR